MHAKIKIITTIKTTGNVGSFFIVDNDIPNQYRTYLSGNIDPDFRYYFIFNRTALMNDITVGTRQYDIGGPSIKGLVLDHGKMLGVDTWVVSA